MDLLNQFFSSRTYLGVLNMLFKYLKNIIVFLILSITSLSAFSIENSFSISKGQPTSKQNKTIHVQDFIYQRFIDNSFSKFINLGITGRIGNLQVGNEQGTRFGIGSYATFDMFPFTISVPVFILMLDKSGFGINKKATKNYGGKLQFTYGFDIGYQINEKWELFYRFEHMSNANRYKFNPGLDSHNLGVKLYF